MSFKLDYCNALRQLGLHFPSMHAVASWQGMGQVPLKYFSLSEKFSSKKCGSKSQILNCSNVHSLVPICYEQTVHIMCLLYNDKQRRLWRSAVTR